MPSAPAVTIVLALTAFCAEIAIAQVRLDPSRFVAAPAAVRAGLKQQGCSVPQTYMGRKPHNVFSGSFINPRAKEWAALCSKDGHSEIVIFNGASAQPLARFAKAPDGNFVQVIAPGQTGYSRMVFAVRSPVRGLNGIEDAFLEKASTVWVHQGGSWHSKPGAD